MLEKVLNAFGLCSMSKYIALKRYCESVEQRNSFLSIKVYEMEKSLSELEGENEKLIDVINDKKFGISILSEELKKLEEENEKLKLKLKIAKNVKRKRR